MKPIANKPLWRLYDSSRQIFFDNLHDYQCKEIIGGLEQKDRAHWYVCRDGDVDWTPLYKKDHELKTSTSAHEPMEIVGLGTFIGEMSETKGSATNTKKKQSKIAAEQRKVKRVKTSVEVFIDVGGEILAAKTKDISLLTIKLDQKFSIKYEGKFYSITIRTKKPFSLRGTPLTGQKESIRGTWNILSIDPNVNLQKLVEFLDQ